ncbi:MAG: phosphoglycolate phosphatase [Verrucomicrobiales bacterium]|jgi:phosphoglycolate phosphatase
MQTRTQAVFFDLDGTLLDSLGDLAESMNAVLRENDLPTHDLDAFRFFIGDGILALVKRSLPEHLHDDTSLQIFLDLYRASYAERWHLSKPFPGIADLLDALLERNIALGVVSNKPDAFTQKCVTELFPQWTWDAVVGQLDHVPSKPDPSGALNMAKQLGISPESCWFVGDSDVDMQTGVNAGMHVVGVAWGFRPESELLEGGAQHILQSPSDLLPLL